MNVRTCPECGAVTFFSGPDGLGDLMGDDCNCQGVGGYTTVDDDVLVVWSEQEEL